MPPLLAAVAKPLVAAGRAGLNPALSAALLALLSYMPAALRDRVVESVSAGNLLRLKNILRVLLALGLLGRANRALTRRAGSNWRRKPQKAWRWRDEVAVVTGGCSGIGRGIAQALAARGVRVAVLDLQDLPADLQSSQQIEHFACDVTSEPSVAAAAQAVRQKMGAPSILVNNAGIGREHTILEAPTREVRRVLEVNLLSHWLTTQEFLPDMLRQDKGHIVSLASLASFMLLPVAVEYSASKAGLLAFHEGLACEIKHHHRKPGVLTTIVHPYYVRTPLTEYLFQKPGETTPEARMGKFLAPDDVVRPVVDQILSVRGGQLIIPGHYSFLSGLRAWPGWMQELLRDVVGKRVFAWHHETTPGPAVGHA